MTKERRYRRRIIVEDYLSLCITIPLLEGRESIKVLDINEYGIKLRLDDKDKTFVGERMSARFYISESLFLPIELEVLRIDDPGAVACVYVEPSAGAVKALEHLVGFIEIALINLVADS